MRLKLDIRDELLSEAREILKLKSKTQTVIASLRELIRRQKVKELREAAGTSDFTIDLPASRRRPALTKKSRK